MRLSAVSFALLPMLGGPGDVPHLALELNCPAREDPGRVVCELGVDSPASWRLLWVDALVTRAPAFVKPLRSRVTTALPPAGEQTTQLSAAFVATGLGRAELGVRVRAVLCSPPRASERRACVAAQGDAAALVSIGP